MSIIVLLAYWYTYSKWYILGSWFITYILNIAFKKLWLSPLLINALALGVLFIGIYYKLIEGQEVGASVLNVYMPIATFPNLTETTQERIDNSFSASIPCFIHFKCTIIPPIVKQNNFF